MKMKKNGFTLIELIIAMAIGALIMTAVYAAVNMSQKSSASVGRKVTTQQDARAVLDLMAMEIRMASYNPKGSNDTWNSIPTSACSSMGNVLPNPANKGIQTANANTILIAMDLDGSGIIGAGTNEYIEYSYNGADTINRNVSCGGDQAVLGGSDTDVPPPTTKVINAAAGVNLFTYFDGNGYDITATVVNPANNPNPTNGVPAIRRIRITIVAQTHDPDSLTNNYKTMNYTTDVLVMNHALCK